MNDNRKVIFNNSDTIFMVKDTKNKGTRGGNYKAPNVNTFIASLYMRDGRTFVFKSPACLYNFSVERVLDEVALQTALYCYKENKAMVMYPIVDRVTVEARIEYDNHTKSHKKVVYWSEDSTMTVEIGSYITNFIATDFGQPN